MKIEAEEEVPDPGQQNLRSSIKRMFYVNRSNFRVTSDPADESRPIQKVWGNLITQMTKKPNSAASSTTNSVISAEDSVRDGSNHSTASGSKALCQVSSQPPSSQTEKVQGATNRALGLIKRIPLARPLLRRFGASEEEQFELPSEYQDSSDDEISEFDPEAVYILPVLGESHIFEKKKTIVLRRDMFNAKHVKSTFNIVDKRNKFHFRVEAELYDLKRQRVLTDKHGKPTMGLRYDFIKSAWHILGGENLKERRAVVMLKKGLFGNSCLVYVHLPPYPLAMESPALDGVKPFLRVKGSNIENGFEVWNIHEDKMWARIKKDLEYLTHWTFGTDSYYVEVQPYIDTALMIAVGIIMEEETTTERERPYITGNLLKDVMLQVADNVYR